MAALELGVGGEDEDLVAQSLRAWHGENMIGVGVDYFFDQDRMAQLFYLAIQVDDPDHI